MHVKGAGKDIPGRKNSISHKFMLNEKIPRLRSM
jgi:hypothetical protein